MASWIWVLIPLAAILMGGFKEWLKFKQKQDKLGTSTSELEAELREVKEALREREERKRALERRIQNLETIVTSESWDALVADREMGALDSGARLELSESNNETAERAERIARRLRG